MDYRDATQVQTSTPAGAAAEAASKLPLDGVGRYLRMFETLRLGVARANRELLRAALDVVEQEVSSAEARHHGSFAPSSAPGPRPVAASSPGKPGLPTRSPTERFRGVPAIREAPVSELHPKAEE
ncbi:hypothetical protein [Cystobacter ferrugineus]|uniref:Uncharacterized protein n=1 Tax=Cystobacter ferrugineus TaxID=83449 RepID=A0A1L9AVB2_9BACT|nr:hypothetical protein [Cystobacter ferrugineus]OJH33936.1 hypothetical protein BON30_46275 [Cystobacter ferrugineus]